jgi:hypothetical protein
LSSNHSWFLWIIFIFDREEIEPHLVAHLDVLSHDQAVSSAHWPNGSHLHVYYLCVQGELSNNLSTFKRVIILRLFVRVYNMLHDVFQFAVRKMNMKSLHNKPLLVNLIPRLNIALGVLQLDRLPPLHIHIFPSFNIVNDHFPSKFNRKFNIFIGDILEVKSKVLETIASSFV